MLGASGASRSTRNGDKAPIVTQGTDLEEKLKTYCRAAYTKRLIRSVIKQSNVFTLRVVLQSLITAAAMAQLTNDSTERSRSGSLSWPVLIGLGS